MQCDAVNYWNNSVCAIYVGSITERLRIYFKSTERCWYHGLGDSCFWSFEINAGVYWRSEKEKKFTVRCWREMCCHDCQPNLEVTMSLLQMALLHTRPIWCIAGMRHLTGQFSLQLALTVIGYCDMGLIFIFLKQFHPKQVWKLLARNGLQEVGVRVKRRYRGNDE